MSSKIVVPFFKTHWICLKNLGCLPQPRGFLGSQDFDGKLHSQKGQDEDIQDMVALRWFNGFFSWDHSGHYCNQLLTMVNG